MEVNSSLNVNTSVSQNSDSIEYNNTIKANVDANLGNDDVVINVNVSAKTGTEASATMDSTHIDVSYSNTTEVSAGVSVGNDYANTSVTVSAKTGTEASAGAGLDGNNAHDLLNILNKKNNLDCSYMCNMFGFRIVPKYY